MGDVDGKTHVGEVEAVREGDEEQGDDVMGNKLLEVLPRLLHAQHENDGLLGPVSGLEEIVELECAVESLVWEVFIHASRIKIPDGGARHNDYSRRAEDAKVECRVQLLHKADLLASGPETRAAGQRPEHLLHNKLTSKREDDGIKCDESNIPAALTIVWRYAWGKAVGRRQLVAEEDEVVYGIFLGGVNGVEADKDGQDGQGKHPRVLDGVVLEPSEDGACLAFLVEALSSRGDRG